MFFWLKKLLFAKSMEPIVKGQWWSFYGGTPWPLGKPVEIVDVKEGWVLYSRYDGQGNDRERERLFREFFRKVE